MAVFSCPSSDRPRKSLPLEIHAVTRSYHTSLNRLITSRLPLCLPSYASDSSTYLHGISAFAEIYFTFETEWTCVISSEKSKDVSPRVRNLLRSLYHPSLLRSTKLNHDLSLLSRQHTNHERPRYSTSTTPATRASIQSRPHVLLAYSWIMYLALFNGGRWIRSQLLSAVPIPGRNFWPDGLTAEDCLTFWHFDGKDDSEDIKNEFKSRFDAVAAQLTETERQDVIEEAVEIFKLCGRIVEELDLAFCKPSSSLALLALLSMPLVSGVTSQLFGILAWMWGLVSGPIDKAQRGVLAGQGMGTREQEVR